MKKEFVTFIQETKIIHLIEGEYFLLKTKDAFFSLKEGVVDLLVFEKPRTDLQEALLYLSSFEKNDFIFSPSKNMSPPYLFLRAHTEVYLYEYSFESLNKSNDQNIKEAFFYYLTLFLKKLEENFHEESHQKIRKVCVGKVEVLAPEALVCFKADKLSDESSILWMQAIDQQISVNGEDDYIFKENDFLPITKNDIIFAKEKAQIRFLNPLAIDVSRIDSTVLDLFYQKIFSKISKKTKREKKNHQVRLLEEIHREKKLVSDSCFLLSQVLNITDTTAFSFSTDLLIKACQRIALVHQSPITLAKIPSDIVLLDDKIKFIAEKSNFSFRKVKLSEELFSKDFEPLLVFDTKMQEPRVIISNGRSKYFIFNPKDNSQLKFSKEEMLKLDNYAIVFYKNLPKEPKGKALFKQIFENQGFDVAIIISIAVISSVIALYSPIAMGWIFDQAVPSHNKTLLVQILFGLFMVGVGRSVFAFACAISLLRIEGKTSNKLQAALWNRLLNLKVKFYKNYTVGDLWQRVGAVNEIRALLSNHTLNTAVSSFFSFFYFGVMLYRSVFLAFLMLIPLFLTLLIYVVVISMTIKRQLDILNYQGAIYGDFVQLIDSIKKIRMFNAENRAFAKWSSLFSIKKRKEIELMMIGNWLSVSHKIIKNFGTILMYFVVIGFLIKKSEGTLETTIHLENIGEYLSFSAAYGAFSGAIFGLGGAALSIIKDIIPRWQRAKVLFEAEEEIRSMSDKFDHLNGEIELNKISFKYSANAPCVLDRLTLKIKRGAFIGIIGASGAGKSTLIRLILGFEKPESGMILFDDRLQENFDIRFLRQQLGVVLQTGSVFMGSLRDNICSSRFYTDDQIFQALELVCMKEDVESLPMGLETVLPPGGATLSASQRQRLLLARALIQKPSILILDDCLSAIDDEIVEIIKKNLEDLDITRIVVSQKINIIKDTHQIYVLGEGKILEEGSYQALVDKKGYFTEILENESI